MDYIYTFLRYNLGLTDETERTIFIVIMIICIVVIVLRMMITSAYTVQRGSLKLSAKDIKKKEALSNIKYSFLAKIVRDYQNIGEKGIANINTRALVERHISNLSFLGWSYVSMENFIEGFELGIVFIGLILAYTFDNSKMAFGLFAAVMFIVFKILSAIFDFKLVREKLTYDIIDLVDTEIGQFYIGDFTSAINRLKVELIGATTNQAAILSQSIEKLKEDLSLSLDHSILNLGDSFQHAMEDFAKYAEILDEPLVKWKEAVDHAYDAQQQMNGAAFHLNDSVDSFDKIMKETIKDFNTSINGLDHNMTRVIRSISEQIDGISRIADGLTNGYSDLLMNYKNVEKMNEIMSGQSELIIKNQQVLDKTINDYEESLKEMTSSLSNGFGSILSLHMEEAYHNLNDELKANINKITTSNTEVIRQLEKLFSEIFEQSKAEMQTLLKMKEQIDLYFEGK